MKLLCSLVNSSVIIGCFATKMYEPTDRLSTCKINKARSNLFALFLLIALPIFLLATNPTL
jgi:hypothetical protein